MIGEEVFDAHELSQMTVEFWRQKRRRKMNLAPRRYLLKVNKNNSTHFHPPTGSLSGR